MSAKDLSSRECAAIALRIPTSGTVWLDDMIQQARVLDLAASITAVRFDTDMWATYTDLAKQSLDAARVLLAEGMK